MTRKQRASLETKLGLAMMAAAIFGFALLVCGAAVVDQARGVSIAESLQSAGL